MFGPPLSFTSPWILGFLVILPALWWLLRLTPPSPQKIIFPALSLLRGLSSPLQTPVHTPWWILLLRLLAIAAVIIAFAGPVVNPETIIAEHGRLLIVVDNDWASARAWDVRQRTLHDLIHQAERSNRDVLLLPTTPASNGDPLHIMGPLTAKAAYGAAETIKPEPWPAEWREAVKILEARDCPDFSHAIWLSSGVGDIDTKSLYRILQQHAVIRVLNDSKVPIYLLTPPEAEEDHLVLTVKRAVLDEAETVSVAALASDGHRLSEEIVTLNAGVPSARVVFDLPLDVRNQIVRFQVERQITAATTVILDDTWQKRPVGLVGDPRTLAQHSLLNDLFYIDRALSPFADLQVDTLEHLLRKKMAVIIMTDAVTIPDDQKSELQAWIKQGGLLLRFAGAHVAAAATGASDDFLAVALRNGDRAMGGALSWATPQKMHDFPLTSPFRGLAIPDDITVGRQVLAEPSEDLKGRSWATLADGTPLVTAKTSGQGMVILFHVPARSDWSNLPLSGLFVDMLHRIVDLSHGIASDTNFNTLPPFLALDAFGEKQKPDVAALPLLSGEKSHLLAGPQHPPGLYGTEAYNIAFNLGGVLVQPEPFNIGETEEYTQESGEIEGQPYMLMLAFGLLMVDFMLSLFLRGLVSFSRREAALSLLVLLGALTVSPAESAESTNNPVDLTAQTYMAYVKTGNSETDHLSDQGLNGLAHIVKQRTSIDRIAVVGVDPDKDDLAFYPLLYWPLKSGASLLSSQAVEHVNAYLHHGGMILLDSMDGQPLPPSLMQHLLSGVDVPPLSSLPQDHVLKHSFYLLDEFPGRYASTDFLLEPEDMSSYDGVATVLYGVNGYAAAWATDETGHPLFACTPGGELQREYAYRFGINLVMYALTGNYKSDQLHAQGLLKKLGR